MELGLKIDVCTFAGMWYGVPALLRLLDRLAIRASFFVAVGPDHSGRAARRMLRPGFLEKMWRTRALTTYGWRTILYGTVLPGPHIGRRCSGLLREIVHAGHELAVHGYNHFLWQDCLPRWSRAEVTAELARAWAVVVDATGVTPQSFGAPGWQCTATSLECEDALGLLYHSDTRGRFPYYPAVGGKIFQTLEIPTTLRTLDETWGTVADDFEVLQRWYCRQLVPGLNVYTAHAEMEGRNFLPFLQRWLEALRALGVVVKRLDEIARATVAAPCAEVQCGTVVGRSGTVAMQGAAIDSCREA